MLLVDDAKANLDILVEGLKCDYKLSLALNGEMALQAVKRTPPDLVLLDIVMPGMDGYEVARKIREQPEWRDLTLIALTGWGQEEDRRRTSQAGFDHHLLKPADMTALESLFMLSGGTDQGS